MAQLRSSSLTFSLAILMLISFKTILSASIDPEKHVHMRNDLASNTVLNLYCKSKDDDLGQHVLSYQQEFTWSFRDNFSGTTVFWCSMTWTGSDDRTYAQSFDVYTTASSTCAECTWSAQLDGVYLFDENAKKYVMKYSWTIVGMTSQIYG